MRTLPLLALLTALTVVPSVTHAQERGRERDRYRGRERERERDRDRRPRDGYGHRFEPTFSLMVGALRTDYVQRKNVPMGALRADWRLSRIFWGEVDATYALGTIKRSLNPNISQVDASLATTTLGLQAELPIPIVRPYIGIATGLFGRFDNKRGQRYVRPTQAFPVGLRVWLSPSLALRAEVRWRFDPDPTGRTAVNIEQTAGLSFRY